MGRNNVLSSFSLIGTGPTASSRDDCVTRTQPFFLWTNQRNGFMFGIWNPAYLFKMVRRWTLFSVDLEVRSPSISLSPQMEPDTEAIGEEVTESRSQCHQLSTAKSWGGPVLIQSLSVMWIRIPPFSSNKFVFVLCCLQCLTQSVPLLENH